MLFRSGWANRNRAGGAPDYYDANWYPHSNIIIQDNYINQGASAYACNGIYLTSSKDSVIQRNVLEHIGTCGIELYFADNVAVQYNEISDVVKKGGGADDNAIAVSYTHLQERDAARETIRRGLREENAGRDREEKDEVCKNRSGRPRGLGKDCSD